MDAATVFKLLSLIPDRNAAMLSGAACTAAATCKYPERVAFIAQRAHWLGPLDAISKEEQRMLGLLSPHGRPAHETGEESAMEEEADLEVEESFAPPAEEEPAQHAAL